MVQKRCVLFLLATCLFTFSIYAQNLAVRNRTTTNHEVFAPYWTMEPGWHTDLEIRNNNISSKVTVTPVLRTAEGVEVQLDELTLQPNEVKSISLMDALGKRAPQLLHRANAYGSVKVRYVSVNAANIYASVMIHREGHPIAFHMDTFEANPEFKAGSYESIWWLPSSTTESYFVVTNLSDMPYKGDLAVSDAAGLTKSLPAAIGPRQTKRFTDRELISHFGFGGELGGIAVSFTSGAGNIQVAHVGFDETNGFSTLMKVFGKDPSSAVSAVSLRAPTVALSLPDPALHFPDGTSMQSQVWLRNTSEKALSVQAQVDWRSSDTWGRAEPITISVAPRQTRVLDLSQLQSSGSLPASAQWATVNVAYSGKDGDLVAIATSFADAGRLLVQSPFSDTLTYLWKGGQWEVDTNHNALITTGNAGEKPSRVQFTIVYDGGSKKYELPVRTLQPGEAMMVNVAKLVQDQLPDKNGNRLPTDITAGAYEYEDIDDNLVGYLYEGKQAIDLTNGHVAYGCALCCYKDDWYNTSFLGNPNFTGPIDVKVSDSCTGQYTTNTPSAYSWSSLDGSITTVSPGAGFAVAPGDTFSSAFINLKTFQGGKLCSLKPQNPTGPAKVRNFTVSDPIDIEDGGQGSFSITNVVGGTATGYQWTFSSPDNSGNSPHVSFSNASAAQTTTDGHWFANPDQECPNTTRWSTYTISATVTFAGTPAFSLKKDSRLTVTLPQEGGHIVGVQETDIEGYPDISVDPQGVYRIAGVGNLSRRVPTTYILNISSSSQFFSKLSQHEQKHVDQWKQGSGYLMGDLFLVSDFYEQIQSLTAATEDDLVDSVDSKRDSFYSAQMAIYNQRYESGTVERQAYDVSDPIAPRFLYQNCGRF